MSSSYGMASGAGSFIVGILLIFLIVMGSIPPLIVGSIGLSGLTDDNKGDQSVNFPFCPVFGEEIYKVISALYVVPIINVIFAPPINFGLMKNHIKTSSTLNYKVLSTAQCAQLINSTCISNDYLNCDNYRNFINCKKYGDDACNSQYQSNYHSSYNFYNDHYNAFITTWFALWVIFAFFGGFVIFAIVGDLCKKEHHVNASVI